MRVCRRLLLLALTLSCCDPVRAEQPNIVLIMVDDMGYSDVGCYGGEIRTPNIDRLAAEGLRFTQFYNNAKCTTTRASLITGLFPRPTDGLLKAEMVTIPEVLRDAGYYCVLSGKWHLGNSPGTRPTDRGFHHTYGLRDGCCNFFDPSIPDPDFKDGKVRWFGEDDERITTFPEGFYTTDAFTSYAVSAIDDSIKNRQPLFLHLTYTAPHYPLHAPAEDVARYRGKYLMGWHELRKQRHERQLAMGLIDPSWDLPPADPEVEDWASIEQKDYYDHLMAVYAAMIDRVDQGIGRILARLDEYGMTDNTIIMFLADNGGCAEEPGGMRFDQTPGIKETYTAVGPGWAYAQNTPFRRYKAFVHEGGISTPFIVKWPGVTPPNSFCREVGHIIDLLPTCADIAGASYPAEHHGQAILPCEGRSLRPLFSGGTRQPHETLYWEWGGNRAVREGDLKLAWDTRRKQWELYDVVADRTEMHDLAASDPAKVKDLSDKWFAWAKATGVKEKKAKVMD
jgi:arylsulfatase A-like enzyme